MRFIRYLSLAAAASLAGCSSLDLGQPEIPLPAPYASGADIRLSGFEGSDSLDTGAEGPSLTILRDQLLYAMVRCSRPGPRLDLDVRAAFHVDGGADQIIGVATWRDPATRQTVGRHNIIVPVDSDTQRQHVDRSTEEDGSGSWVPQGQLAAGEAFAASVCREAFGWSGLPGD